MAGRIYVCPVVGDGSPEDPFRPALLDLKHDPTAAVTKVKWPALLSQVSGHPVHNWVLCWVDADDWTTVEGDTQFWHLSDDVMGQPLPNAVRNQLRVRGYLTRQEADDLGTVGDAVEALMRKHTTAGSLDAWLARVR